MTEPIVLTGLRSVDGASCVDPETGRTYLFLNEGQTMDSAFTRARRLLENLPSDTMRRLVRSNMPAHTAGMFDMPGSVDPSDLLTAKDRPSHRPRRAPVVMPTTKGRWRLLVTGLVWGASAALVGAMAAHEIGQRTVREEINREVERIGADVTEALEASGLTCDVGDDHVGLFCVDADGTGLTGQILRNDQQTAYHLFVGTRKTVTLRAFTDPTDARDWARLSAREGALPAHVGRVTFSGTDHERLIRLGRVVADERQQSMLTYEPDGSCKAVYVPEGAQACPSAGGHPGA